MTRSCELQSWKSHPYRDINGFAVDKTYHEARLHAPPAVIHHSLATATVIISNGNGLVPISGLLKEGLPNTESFLFHFFLSTSFPFPFPFLAPSSSAS